MEIGIEIGGSGKKEGQVLLNSVTYVCYGLK